MIISKNQSILIQKGMPRKGQFSTPEDANITKGEFFCKHCLSVFRDKYTFKRHLEAELKEPTPALSADSEYESSEIPLHCLHAQFTRYLELNEQQPIYCNACYHRFKTRHQKYRHKCTGTAGGAVDKEQQRQMDAHMDELNYLFLLLNGRISDRSFRLGLTYFDVFENYGSDLFLNTFLDRSMARFVESVYKNPVCKTCDIVRFDLDLQEWAVCEYELWSPAKKEIIIPHIFEQVLVLLSVFNLKNRQQLSTFLRQHNTEMRSMLWFDELMSSDGYAYHTSKAKELLQIENLFTLQ